MIASPETIVPPVGEVVLEAEHLSKQFPLRRSGWRSAWRQGEDQAHRAVDDVSLTVRAGEVVGIVGESGSGKTTLTRMLVRLIAPTDGHVRLRGRDIFALNEDEVRSQVRPAIRMIFQDPDAALNPAYPIGEGMRRALVLGGRTTPEAIDQTILALLRQVGMDESYAGKYPDELSGGEKRRLGICRALSTDPAVIVADEPLSGLDVVLQERVLGLLLEAQRVRRFGLVLVSHDLERVHQVCDRVMVMYAGRVVESGPVIHRVVPAQERYRHPYAAQLALANDREVTFAESARRPVPMSAGADAVLTGGCRYRGSCERYQALARPAVCAEQVPELRDTGAGHAVACFFAEAGT